MCGQLPFCYNNNICLNLVIIHLIYFDFGKLIKILRVFADGLLSRQCAPASGDVELERVPFSPSLTGLTSPNCSSSSAQLKRKPRSNDLLTVVPTDVPLWSILLSASPLSHSVPILTPSPTHGTHHLFPFLARSALGVWCSPCV
jgi:hypothetical protein